MRRVPSLCRDRFLCDIPWFDGGRVDDAFCSGCDVPDGHRVRRRWRRRGADRRGSTAEPRIYVEVAVAATLGNTSDKAVGGEAGIRFATFFEVFLEGGHIGNAATADFAARGQKVANNLGANVSGVQKVNYFDVGIRYHVPVVMAVHPYVALGAGIAQVTNSTVFTINGAPVDPSQIALGSDLSGTVKKTFIMFGLGADYAFTKQFFVDASYRFGRILPNTSETENDVAINTNRIQIGVGVRF